MRRKTKSQRLKAYQRIREAKEDLQAKRESEEREALPRALPDDPERVECPDCAEAIKARAQVCRFCGWVDPHSEKAKKERRRAGRSMTRGASAARYGGSKSQGVAVLLSLLLLPGSGHLYAGETGRGFIVLCVWLGLIFGMLVISALFAFALFPVYVWQAVDAAAACRRAESPSLYS